MNNTKNKESIATDQLNDFSGDGEMGALIAFKDWSQTPLGPIESWPDSLKFYLKLMLGSKYQMWLWWGPEYYNFYNDAYAPTLGIKHPDSLGKSSRIIWSEIWDVIGPMVDNVRTTGTSLFYENLLLFLERRGFKEETYHTFSYSPLPDGQGGIGGVFCAVSEDTKKVLSQRRLATLQDLSDSNTRAKTEEEVCRFSCQVLKKNPNDIPFALIYLFDKENRVIELKEATGAEINSAFAPLQVNLDNNGDDKWRFSEVIDTRQNLLIKDLPKFNNIPNGPWGEPPSDAIVLPIFRSGQDQITGFLVSGLSSRLLLDNEYKNFLSLVTGQISTALSNVRALEEERRRAEALAEVDKAKTVFFSNVSHEFRTPLTLMLGPLQEILNRNPFNDSESREQISIIYRNSLRLLRLVNTLLDFSKIEAGRLQAVYRETDISSFTADLSSNFRSAIESAGLKFNTQFEKITEPVYVDHTLWERIVFNLLSNAFKFTFNGEITVSLSQKEHYIELKVKDTGTGISKEELPKLFSRFHRIENSRGRTHEGSGIGLAMVSELVKMHGGKIEVDSVLGEGTTFTVSVPVGKDHLPNDRIASPDSGKAITLNALPDLDEELSSFNTESSSEMTLNFNTISEVITGDKDKVLVADDNRDMREYIKNLLKDRYEVITVKDGLEAMEVIRKDRPALILSDVMMPNLDGIGLVKEIRSDMQTSSLPVILISARAGEESTIEGIQAGADDYLVKPFSAKELISRVDSNIKIAKTRMFAENNLKNIFKQADFAVTILRGDSLIIELANPKALEVWGKTIEQVLNKPILEALPEIAQQGFGDLLYKVYKTGERFVGNEVPVELIRFGKPETIYLNFIYDALRDTDGSIIGIMALGYDVTGQVKARKLAEQTARELEDANKDIISKNDMLTKINNDLDNFIYTASHDLKAPVANIEGLIHSMIDALSEDSKASEEFNAILHLIQKSIDRFKNTILDLTEVSKAQKLSEEDIEEIICNEIIEDVRFTIRDQIEKAGAEIKVDVSECQSLRFSRKNFQSIVYNLLSNAIKYRDHQRPLVVNLTTKKEGEYMIFTVSDNGLGINETNKAKLFTMFKRFHDHVEGTGIGLYIVKKIIDNAGGKIQVESDLGKGTTFNVYFPL